jgi:tetratricopeptide (TPR) repeat protein
MFLLPTLPGMETPEQRRRKRLFWAALVLLAGLGVAAYFYGIRWRAAWLVAEAERLNGQRQPQLALARAESALGLTPDSIRARRAAAMALSQGRHPAAAFYWQQVVAQAEATATDYESAIDAAVGARKFDIAEGFADGGLRRFPGDTGVLRRGASLFEMAGDPVRSMQCARKLLEVRPEDDLTRLILERQELARGTPAERVAAKDEILGIAERDPALRLEALKWIAQLNGLGAEDLRKCLRLLDQSREQGLEWTLRRGDFLAKLQPEKTAELARAVAQQGRPQAGDAAQMAELGRWLNSKNQYEPVLSVIGPEAALNNRDLFLIRMDALSGLKRWSEIEATLASQSLPIEPVLAGLFRIRAVKELGTRGSLEDLWSDLERSLLRQPEATYYIGQYLEKMGEMDRLEKLYREVVRVSPRTVAAYAGLIQLAEAKGDLRRIMEILKEASQRDPEYIAYQNDYAYLSLLSGQAGDDARAIAEKMVKARPEDPGFRVTLALSKLKSGDTNGALAALRPTEMDWNRLSPGQQAVAASVLASAGKRQEAFDRAKAIDVRRLKAPEFDLLKRWLNLK